MTSKR